MPASGFVPPRSSPPAPPARRPWRPLRACLALLAILLLGMAELLPAFEAPSARPLASAVSAVAQLSADEGGAHDEDQAGLWRPRPLRVTGARADLDLRPDLALPDLPLPSRATVVAAMSPPLRPAPPAPPRDPPLDRFAPRGPPGA